MNGGISDKHGYWYEETCVVHRLLRLITEQDQSLLWEGLGADSDGVDYWYQTGDQRIAVQCKTCSTGPWSIADLGYRRPRKNGGYGASILSYARHQLERSDPDRAHIFRLESDQSAPDLKSAIDSANREKDPHAWFRQNPKAYQSLISGFGLDANEVARCHELLTRIEISTIGQERLSEDTWALAHALTPDAIALLDALRRIAREHISQPMDIALLHAAISTAGASLPPSIDTHRFAPTADSLTASFLDSLARVRVLTAIPRAEADTAVQAIRGESLPHQEAPVIVVHGPPGVGKSEVIAQAVVGLQAADIPLLALRADQVDDTRLGPDPVRSLRAIAGSRSACMIIDQIDQLVIAGTKAQASMDRIARWIGAARALNIAIILGCRTVDLEHDTQIRAVLPQANAYLSIRVDDLTDIQAHEVLSAAGIPVATIHPELRMLIRRPLILRLLTDIVARHGEYRGIRTTLDLVDQWWRYQCAPLGRDADKVLANLMARVESDHTIAVDRHLLGYPEAVDRLLVSGVLVPGTDSDRVRPFHQILIDVGLAKQWSAISTIEQLIARIGTKDQQDLHQARRLRLSVSLFANRGRAGADVIDGILRHTAVRTLLKRAVLMGLASVDRPDQALVDHVKRWLADPLYKDPVRKLVCYGHLPWMDALDGWLDEAWSNYPDCRDDWLELLVPISISRGDEVAAHLVHWGEQDSKVIDRLGLILWQSPTKPSDALFEVYMRSIAREHIHDGYYEWLELLTNYPSRAIRILSHHITRMTDEELMESRPSWFQNWPTTLPESVDDLGMIAWSNISERWNHFADEESYKVTRDTIASLGSCVLFNVVDLLSRCLAHACCDGSMSWNDVEQLLPHPLRWLDSWLLLRIGSRVDSQQGSTRLADDALEWFMSDPRWARTTIGFQNESWDLPLVQEFLRKLSPLASSACFDRLERWLADYSDADVPWPIPGASGWTAYLLLPSLPKERRSASSRQFQASLSPQFDLAAERIKHSYTCIGGIIRSSIPDDEANALSPDEWIERIRQAPEHGQWTQIDPDTVASNGKTTLISQLQTVVQGDPQRFLDAFDRFVSADPPLPSEAMRAILDGILHSSQMTPSTATTSIRDQALSLLERPEFVDEQHYSSTIIHAVDSHPTYVWPERIVARLIQLAKVPRSHEPTPPGKDGFTQDRWNDLGCRALDALGHLAFHHDTYRPALLRLAEAVSTHTDPSRRACAGVLAWRAHQTDKQHAIAVILAVATDPEVAGERDVTQALLWIVAHSSADSDVHARALVTLIGLATSTNERLARRGGQAILQLRAWGYLPPEQLTTILTQSTPARSAAAHLLANWLRDPEAPPWIHALALEFIDDPDPAIAGSILFIFNNPPGHFRTDSTFFAAVVKHATAAQHDPHDLLRACTKLTDILPLAAYLLSLIQTIPYAKTKPTPNFWWERHRNADIAVDLLARLVAECDQQRDVTIRTRALDAWDTLLDTGLLDQQKTLQEMTNLEWTRAAS